MTIQRSNDNISGFCDGLHGSQIIGWVVNHDRAHFLESVFVETDLGLRSEFKTAVYHSGLASVLGRNEKFGFAIPISALPKFQDNIRLFDRNGILLENGVVHLPSQLEPVESHAHCAVFMHIPKTGGTALGTALQKCFPAGATCLFYAGSPAGLDWEQASCLPALQRKSFKLLMGHFYFGLDTFLDQPTRYYTFIREPMARLRSHYWHYRALGMTSLHVGGDWIPLAAAVQEGLTDEFDNLQTRMVSGVAPNVVPAGQMSDVVFEMARRNIEKEFAFAGLTERLDEHAQSMFKKMQIKPVSIERENETSRHVSDRDDCEFLSIDWAKVKENNRFDLDLYRYVEASFER